MVEIETRNKNREIIEKQGITKKEEKIKARDLLYLKKMSTAKNYRSYMIASLQRSTLRKDTETAFIIKHFIEKYEEFEKIGTGRLKSWRGKSGIIECIKTPDKVIITRMRRSEPGEKPKEVKIEITKQQLNALLTALNLNIDSQPIETSIIAMSYSKILNLGHSGWDAGYKPFETDRGEHNRLTTALSFLESEGLIKYSRKGRTKIIKDKLEITEIL